MRADRQRRASPLFVAMIHRLPVASSLTVDAPDASVPRTAPPFLLPLAACACLPVRDEAGWPRHRILIACLASFVVFAATDGHLPHRLRAARRDPRARPPGGHRVSRPRCTAP